MTALPQWTINTRPRLPTIMPDPRAYNPAAWTFHTTMMHGETLEEWIGRDMALRCRADGHRTGGQAMSIPTADTLRILALTRKPRTTSEIAEALGVSAATAGQWLATLAGKGRIRKAEIRYGVQIWEAAQ